MKTVEAVTPTAKASEAAVIASPVATLPPTLKSVTLTGTIRVDPAYIVAQGGGNLVAQGGGNILQVAAGLIGQDGAGLIGQDGAGLVGATGGGLIGNDGAGLISQDGGGLIGQDGAGLIGQDGAGYGLLAAGDRVPAAGMYVQAYPMLGSQPIEMVDSQGHVGTTVQTDATGRYKLVVPETYKGGLIIQAFAKPGDARQHYSTLTGFKEGTDHPIDETTTLAADYCQLAAVVKLTEILKPDNLAGGVSDFNVSKEEHQLLVALKTLLKDSAEQGNVKGMTAEERLGLAVIVTRTMVESIDLKKVTVETEKVKFTGPETLALDAIQVSFGRLLDLAGQKPVNELNAMAYVERYNQGMRKLYGEGKLEAQPAPYTIKRAADLGNFVIDAYISNNEAIEEVSDRGVDQSVNMVYRSLGLSEEEADAETARLMAGTNGIVRELFNMNSGDGGKTMERMLAVVAAMDPEKPGNRAKLLEAAKAKKQF